MVSLKSSYSEKFEIKKHFAKFDELSRFKVSCEHGICGSLLFTFSVTFARINIFSIKFFIQNYLLRYKMHQFGVPNR